MRALRTPDDRFANLPDWDLAPRYTDVDSADGSGDRLRIAHYETGPDSGAETILCMHGEPSWSYLYRKMVPVFVASGHRVVLPDLVGFGRSDKPAETGDYTYERHVTWMSEWLVRNDLAGLTLVCQDWGGLIGLRLVAAHPDRFARVVVANTGLPSGDRPMSDAFMAWQKFSQNVPVFDVGKLVSSGCATKPLPEDVIAAYDAPFPDESYKAGARIFPSLAPTTPDDPSGIANRAAWDVLRTFTKPFLTAFSDGDPITAGGDRTFQQEVPGAAGQPHTTIEGGGHFLQEDKGPEFARVVCDFIAGTGR